jgi:hypothetical protein
MAAPLYDRMRSPDPYVRLYALIEVAEMRSKAALSEEVVAFLRELHEKLAGALEAGEANALADRLSLDRIEDLLAKYDNINL